MPSPDPGDVVAKSPPMPAITLAGPQPPSMVSTRAPDASAPQDPTPIAEEPPAPELEALLGQVFVAVTAEPGQPSAAMDAARAHLADAAAWIQEHRRRVAAGEDPYPPPEQDPPAPPSRSRKQQN